MIDAHRGRHVVDSISVQYCITSESGVKEIFDLEFDPKTLVMINAVPADLPAWTALTFHQCPNCPLNPVTNPHCLFAVRLVDIVRGFEGLMSYDKVNLLVVTDERVISQETTAQRALSSMLGLISAASGCPQTRFFRPMARFHLPLANEEETTYRAASMYLLAQYFRKEAGAPADSSLKGLKEIYENIGAVNFTIARRLRAASDTDSTVNAIILLDMFVKTIPYVIEESLETIRYLFEPYLR